MTPYSKTGLMIKIEQLLIVVLALFASDNAHAYLDAGSLTIFLQGIVAAVVGGVVAIKNGWINLKMFASKKKVPPSEEEQ